MSVLPQQPQYRNRYPGVKPFTSADKELFFGREKDIADFYSLLFIKQTVVLYGKSGYGKSSLLNAGIIPRLQEEGEWTCFSVRFNNFSERDASDNVSPMENIKLRLRQNLSPDATAFLDAVIPGEDSFWYWAKVLQSTHHSSQFIFFFDQFEELFTYPKQNVEEFSEQLSQLLYNTVPVRFRRRLAEMDERGEISDELHDRLFERLAVKVVFSIRSDRLSLLNSLTDRHPTILQNYYELDALTTAQAEQAIINPARSPQRDFCTPPFEYMPAAIRKILSGIGNVQDGKIETSTLQIVCRYIEEDLVERRKITTITEELLGDISDIFRQYYEGILSRLGDQDRQKVQHLIEDELIEEGRRNTLTDSYIRNRFGFEGKLLRQLEQSSLLRKERDAAGRILYEISHDTLVNPIEMVAKGRRQAEDEAKQAGLLASLAEEQRKAEHLSELNEKVVRRSRLAIGLAVVSLLIAAGAGYFWYDSRREERTAKLMLFRINLQNAKDIEEPVRTYIQSTDYDMALRRIRAADSLLKAVHVRLTDQDELDKKAFESIIDRDRLIYQESKK